MQIEEEKTQEKLEVQEQQNSPDDLEFVPTTKVYEGTEQQKQMTNFQTIESKISEALRLKNEGNKHYLSKDYKSALRCYNKILLFVNGFVSEGDEVYQYGNDSNKLKNNEQTQLVKDLKFASYSNMAQIHIKNQKYERALDCCNKAILIKSNDKILFRRGTAHLYENNLTEASKDLYEVKNSNPQYPDLDKMIQILQKKETQQDKKLAKGFKNIFIE